MKERYDQFLNRMIRMKTSNTIEELLAIQMEVPYRKTQKNIELYERSLYHKRKILKKNMLKPSKNRVIKKELN